MGPLAGRAQVRDVGAPPRRCGRRGGGLRRRTDCAWWARTRARGVLSDHAAGNRQAVRESQPHDIEAFGPVNTVMPYGTVEEAIELARLGRGSLSARCSPPMTNVAREVVLGVAPYHGRMLVVDRHSAKESTGHGSPMPHLVHGGPGRAGGGEEMGGVRGVLHYMQRTAVQGSPTMLTQMMNEWMPGAAQPTDPRASVPQALRGAARSAKRW